MTPPWVDRRRFLRSTVAVAAISGLVGTALLFFLTVPTAAVSLASSVERVAIPDTPVGRQVSWLLDVSARLPVSQAEATQHFSPIFLEAISVEQLNAALADVAGTTGLAVVHFDARSATQATAVVTGNAQRWLLSIAVDDAGLVSVLLLMPYLDAPTSWEELDRRLRAVAPEVSFLAAEVGRGGRCRQAHGVEAAVARPLGSVFKLYVLGALARAVREGWASWDEQLAVRDDWKSLPSGVVQDMPAGTRLPLRQYANFMISISDNTATDHLVRHLGRSHVETQQRRFGMARPAANQPFLLTRELFQLKGRDYPSLARAYERLDRRERRAYLERTIAPLPLEGIVAWEEPRAINSIEWFASAADLCRAFAGLDRQAAMPGLEPVTEALSLHDGGVGLDPKQWPTVWFKGGSEPGVLALSYLARTADGRTFVVSVLTSNSTKAIDEATAAPELLALVRGAFTLSTDNSR